MGREERRAIPDVITIRQCRFWVNQPGFCSHEVIIITTMLDPREASITELANLYRQRWNNELDLRTIKTDMGMECLRCKSPELVRKEIWVHALAYNLIRTIMAQAATSSSVQPRPLSFKGTLQTLEAFRPIVATIGRHCASTRTLLYEQLLQAIAVHRVADRPNRFEPRRIKRRHKHYVPLAIPRHEAKRQMLQGLAKS